MKLLPVLIVAMMVTLTGCDSPSLSEDEVKSIVQDKLSFNARAGEILGVAGVWHYLDQECREAR
jgi:ABC-type uncharacterized transport system ATPase subunit